MLHPYKIPRKVLYLFIFILFAMLTAILYREQYFYRAGKRMGIIKDDTVVVINYADNYWYKEQTDLQKQYRTHAAVVMLGTSLTFRAQWAELLQRCDVVNRGIPSDVTIGILRRTPGLLSLQPRICFIEGGANDYMVITADSIVKNLTAAAVFLRAHSIIPVMVTTPYLSPKNKDCRESNLRILQLNARLRDTAQSLQLTTLDLNTLLAIDSLTPNHYTTTDGTHLNGDAYNKWKTAVVTILEKEKI